MYTVIIVPTQVSSLEFLSTFFRNVLLLNWHYPTTAIQDSTRYNTAYLDSSIPLLHTSDENETICCLGVRTYRYIYHAHS